MFYEVFLPMISDILLLRIALNNYVIIDANVENSAIFKFSSH